MSRSADTRFAVIEDAAALLQMLPAPEAIAWPSDPGDLKAVDEALVFIGRWARQAKAARKQHRVAMRYRTAAMNGVRP